MYVENNLTLIVYQKFRHSRLCSFPIKPGEVRIVVAGCASVSLVPAIAKYRFVSPVGSKINES